MTELLDAVDALTLVTHHKVRQDVLTTFLVTTDHGDRLAKPVEQQHDTGQSRTVTATEPPLLQQLDDAVASSIGGSASGATLPSERSILRADALYQAVLIRKHIREWCEVAAVPIPRNATSSEALRAWYAGMFSMDATNSPWHLDQMTGWARSIRAMLNPPHEMDLPFACPICEANTWWDKATGDLIGRPLVIRYRDGEPVDNSRALCRACEQVWSVRELAWQLEHPDTPQEATPETA